MLSYFFILLENRHPLIRNIVTVQIWLGYKPFITLISLNYHYFIGYKWNISQIPLIYKGCADSLFWPVCEPSYQNCIPFCWQVILFYVLLESRHPIKIGSLSDLMRKCVKQNTRAHLQLQVITLFFIFLYYCYVIFGMFLKVPPS